MNKTANVQEIKAHIKNDIHNCDELLRLLDAELEALKERKPDTLEGIITAKVNHLKQLEANAQQRSLWVSTNPPSSKPNEQLWLQLLNSLDPKLEHLWKTLQGKFKDCQHQNEVNGKVLARNQQAFKRILGIMRGQSEPQDLYTPHGNRSNNGWQQTIGEA